MEEAPTKEVVKALLDYLVDPLLASNVSKKDPSLHTQEAVAKQMRAVVLLYNYYHRLQNPKLEFMEFGEFCKLAVSLKPALIAHMKYTQQADLTESDGTEAHLSITEKAIKNACKIALALTSLKDFSHVEKWPVSKVSVLLIDSKKDKCLMSYNTITNGVWSVIEKCLNSADLSLEGPSKSKPTNKKKRKAGNVLTGAPIDGELAYQRLALSAVNEATGLKQSEITVLEKHVTYSLSEENRAAYFYIVQSTESSNDDIQLRIKTVLESLQGPLLQWTSNDWILTQKIEYYNVLPYAQIMSDWLSRERISDCSQLLNLSRFGGGEKDSETEVIEIVKVNFELENTNTNSSKGPEKPNDGEVRDNMGSIRGKWIGADSWSKESSGADTSNRKKKVDDKEKSDKESPEMPSGLAPNGADTHNREEVGDEEKHDNCTTENPNNKEIKDNRGSVFGNCTGANSLDKESCGTDCSDCMEKVDEKEKPDKKFPEKPSDGEPTGADTSNRKEVFDEEQHDNCTTEKPGNREIKDNRGSVFGKCTVANSCGKESSGADSSNSVEKVDEKEKPDKKFPEKPRDGEPTGADTSNRKEVCDEEKNDNCTTEKPSNKEIKDNRGSVLGNCTGANSCGEESTGESSSGVEKVDEKGKPDKKFPDKPSDGPPIGADTLNRKEIDVKENSDKCTLQKPSAREIQENKVRIYRNCSSTNACGKESIGVEQFYMEEDVDEKPDKKFPEFSSDGELTGVDSYNRNDEADCRENPDNNAPEKPSDRDVQGDMHGDCMDVQSCGKESIGEESSNKKEVDTIEKPDKYSTEMTIDVEPTGAETFRRSSKDVDDSEKPNGSTPEKPSNAESKDNVGNIYENCVGPNSGSEEPTGADSFNRNENFDDKANHDKCYDIRNSNPTSFSTADKEVLNVISAEDPQMLPNFSSKRQKTSIYGIAVPCLSRGGNDRNSNMPIRVYHHQKRKISVECCPGSSAALTRCNKEASEAAKKSSGNEFVDGKVAGICTPGYLSAHLNDIPAENSRLVPYEPNANDAGKLQMVLATKGTEISDVALKVLLQKREEMCHQQRILEDKIASCSRDIQKIIDGDGDALALKLEVMIDCCNDTWLKGMMDQSDVQRTGECSMRNRQSDSIVTVLSSCQELDNMCRTNNWRLPVYLISALTGGFIAKVAMKEMDFDLSFKGELKSTPHAARDSAAALMVAKLSKT